MYPYNEWYSKDYGKFLQNLHQIMSMNKCIHNNTKQGDVGTNDTHYII